MMRFSKITPVYYSAVLAFVFLAGCGSKTKNSPGFTFVESTIRQLHEALKAGEITCEQVVLGYLARIEAYDPDSTQTALASVITVNPEAVELAREKDKTFKKEKELPPLYCVTVLVKDNINTKEMPTTGGALVFKNNRPPEDAFIIRRLKEQGAIILGKANMDEFAFGFRGESSVRGLVKNAYDLTKGAGGSSSGTGTSIAASLAHVGLGTDTGGSIQVPSSLGGLVGIRPSMRLISQEGIMPLQHWHDTAGPMCRAVEDCAVILEAMTGFDSSHYSNQKIDYSLSARQVNNEAEYQKITRTPAHYTAYLDKNGLQGMRIGVVRNLFTSDSIAVNYVNPVLEEAVNNMKMAGAVVEDIEIADIDSVAYGGISLSVFRFRSDLTEYLNSWPNLDDHHILSYEELLASEEYLSANKKTLESRGKYNIDSLSLDDWIKYNNAVTVKPLFARTRIMQALNNEDIHGNPAGEPFDLLLYPAIVNTAGELGKSVRAGSPNRMSPESQFPVLVMPAGMAENLEPAQPVGMGMLAREFEEPLLIKAAFSYQELFRPRVPPRHTPEIN